MKTLKEKLSDEQLNNLQQISSMIKRGYSADIIMTNWERFLRDSQIGLKGMKPEEAKKLADDLIAHIQNSEGEDAQLANVDVQSAIQKQQQTIQMMSNIIKLMQDTAMSVIRKIGG